MSFTIKHPKNRSIKPGIPLVFIDGVHFLKNLFDNLCKNLGECYVYHLSQDFIANELDLIKKKGFFPMTIGVVLKSLRKVYLSKIKVLIH